LIITFKNKFKMIIYFIMMTQTIFLLSCYLFILNTFKTHFGNYISKTNFGLNYPNNF
jgi:hypothetical protein